MLKFHFEFTVKKHEVIAFFNFVSIATTEKRPLSYETFQSVHRPHYCGVQTLPLKMHYGGENWGGDRGRSVRILTYNELDLTFCQFFWVPNYGAKFHQN